MKKEPTCGGVLQLVDGHFAPPRVYHLHRMLGYFVWRESSVGRFVFASPEQAEQAAPAVLAQARKCREMLGQPTELLKCYAFTAGSGMRLLPRMVKREGAWVDSRSPVLVYQETMRRMGEHELEEVQP